MKKYLLLLLLITIKSEANPGIVELRKDRNSIIYRFENKDVFSRDSIWVKSKDKIYSFPIRIEAGLLSADMEPFAHYRENISYERSTMVGNICIDVFTDAPFIIYNFFSVPKSNSVPYFCIPGVLYGTNNLKGGFGQEMKFDYGGKENYPSTPAIYTRSDRSPNPGVIMIKDKKVILIGIKEVCDSVEFDTKDSLESRYLYNGLMIDSRPNDEDKIGFSIGYEHYPRRYNSTLYHNLKTTGFPTDQDYRFGYIKNQKGKNIRTKVIYFIDKADNINDFSKGVKTYYEHFHQVPTMRSTRNETIVKLADAFVNDTWQEKNNIFGLNEKPNCQTDIAWTGGMQMVYPLLKAGYHTGNTRYISLSKRFINELVNNGFNKAVNLFYENKSGGKWTNENVWWKDYYKSTSYSAYLNGQASYFVLKSYELTNRECPKWLDVTKKVIENAIKNQNKSGSYPCSYDAKSGDPFDYENFQSCWYLPGIAMMYKLTKDKTYLKSAEKAVDFYHEFYKKGELFGTPLDTYNSVDQEGNLAFIMGCVELHKITKNPKYLNMAVDGFQWNNSWQFSYNTKHSSGILRKLNWSSSGGCITSVHNTSIHQMGNMAAGSLYYIYSQTKDQYLYSRLHDMCIWGLGTYNRFDGEFGFGKIGWSTEQFYHTDAFYHKPDTPWDGGVWKNYLTWASACVLLNCLEEDIPDALFEQ
jgi:hypothetical protein